MVQNTLKRVTGQNNLHKIFHGSAGKENYTQALLQQSLSHVYQEEAFYYRLHNYSL